jgi:DNA-binding transcriptional regulator YiaG
MTVMAKKKPAKLPTPRQIRAARGERSQAEAAELVGVSQSLWSAWERGAKVPSRRTAILIRLLKEGKI